MAKYVTNHDPAPLLKRFLNVPEHVLPEGFDAVEDQMKFDWESEDTVGRKLKKLIYTKEFKAKTKQMDFLFDLTGVALLVLHILMAFPGTYYHVIPAWL